MSILQGYEKIRKQIGEEKYQAIQEYLKENSEILLSDVYYKKSEWDKFEIWFNKQK